MENKVLAPSRVAKASNDPAYCVFFSLVVLYLQMVCVFAVMPSG
jgi:hypothetical protein